MPERGPGRRDLFKLAGAAVLSPNIPEISGKNYVLVARQNEALRAAEFGATFSLFFYWLLRGRGRRKSGLVGDNSGSSQLSGGEIAITAALGATAGIALHQGMEKR